MAVLTVVHAPARVLSRPAAEVDPLDAAVARLASDLVDTMRAHPGCVGLAAPQVAVGAQLLCLDVTGHRKASSCAGLVVLANPVLTVAADDEPETASEGCLSVPDLTADVERAAEVVVTGVVPGTGERRQVAADAFEARALAHEIDHIGGLLFLDRVAGAHAVHARRRYL